jgi:hypothetical protein
MPGSQCFDARVWSTLSDIVAFGAYPDVVAEWFSIEVLDGRFTARAWGEAWADPLVQAGFSLGLSDWALHQFSWGTILELELPDEQAWAEFRDLAAVKVALDSVPDPVNGLMVHRGRGGSSAAGFPRRPRPLAGAGAAALPVPEEELQPEIDAPKWVPAGEPAALTRDRGACVDQPADLPQRY